MAAVQDIPPSRALPTPASTPYNLDLSDEQTPTPLTSQPIAQEEEPTYDGGRLDNTCVNDGDGPSAAQANDHPLLNYGVCSLSGNDRYNPDPPEAKQSLDHGGTSSVPRRLNTIERASSKRKQTFQNRRASKRTHFNPINTADMAWNEADTCASAAVLIQRSWRSREQAKAWRQYQHKVALVQSLWRGKQACLAYG